MFDFLALDKTGIIVVLPDERLRHHDGEAVLTEDPQHFLAGAFVHIHQPTEIKAAVDEALREDAARRQLARGYRDYLFYGLDGRASLRLKTTVEQLLTAGEPWRCV